MKRVLEQALVVAPVAPYFPASHARQSSGSSLPATSIYFPAITREALGLR